MTWALTVLIALPLAAEPSVTVVPSGGGVYRIDGRFKTTAAPTAAWSVLSDYESIPSFVPSMKTSHVLQRTKEGALVEQRSVGKVLIFRRELRVVLDVIETPGRELSFSDVSGQSFRLYKGSWKIEPQSSGSGVSYHLEARGAFMAPSFVAKGSVRKMVEELLENVRRQMEKR